LDDVKSAYNFFELSLYAPVKLGMPFIYVTYESGETNIIDIFGQEYTRADDEDQRLIRVVDVKRFFGENQAAGVASGGVPTEFELSQNYPNPFNASTQISFTLEQGAHAKLEIFNILGESIATLVNKYLPAGKHTASWNAEESNGQSVSSGIYFYRLTAGHFSQSKKMILMK
jgi:hypothetical protein